jgi:hypothetical protein
MRPRYLGDSYDIVKQSLLRWLGSLGAWKAHPMFTEPVTPEEAAVFSRLLGIPLLSADVLRAETDRQTYFATARACSDHLFIDPDTGLCLKPTTGRNHPAYLFGPEVAALVSERPERVTLVFDQSLARGRERDDLAKKMAFLEERSLHSFAYVSHACFIVISASHELLMNAWEVVRRESCLPAARFVKNEKTT